ncbi:TonB-dependent hemoglobin/transferrin/lactoferrin family receptor [Aureimonas fodinaquatilis]|uniref:TonB-dependent hemoglobin/transferrin/lactoferrin family receptor n=1 Tax=Aureimonas fodinaquatilis TaxID=2565783 RepID=A0A5B0DRU6_9HYPH|nr:TonB-dependent hemoglobin/transferrin/lactoferrin family receptor [Aureimonas fodinaquatilis]KAA0968471.1 TonB-dependent hemoglobin/transferrin/lactoferrin family receptor [Aureimonas fodinaquatilis]
MLCKNRVQALYRALLLTAASLALTPAAYAQAQAVATPSAASGTIELDEVSVLSDRRLQSPIETLGGVSIVTRSEIERFNPNRIDEVLATIPGVSVAPYDDDPATSVNIRGLQDSGRVNVMIDGARQNFQVTGHNAGGSFYVEPSLLAGVDVIRGPIANAYGSGAIGGVVAMRTLGIDDLVNPDEQSAMRFGTTIGTNGPNGLVNLEAGTYLTDNADIYGAFALRRNNDYNDGAGNTVDNSGFDVQSGLLKARFRPAEGHQFELAGILYDTTFDSATAGGDPRDTDVTNSIYRLGYTFNPVDSQLVDLNLNIYRTETDYRQKLQDGSGDRRAVDIATTGFDVYNSSIFDVSPTVSTTLTYGVDAFQDNVKTSSDYDTTPLFNPAGERTLYGGFVQALFEYEDLIDFTVGGRFDHYDLSSAANPDNKGERFSPKVSLGVTPIQGFQVYGLYAEGLRAPTLSEALVSGFHPAPAAFEFLPNPALKPEVGRTWEGGINLSYDDILQDGDAFRAKLAIFQNDVDDFIDMESIDRPGVLNPCVAPGPFGRCFARLPMDAVTYVNINEARIRGAEIEAAYDWGWGFTSVAGTYTQGEDKETGNPLDSIFPATVATTIGFRALEDRLSYGARWRWVNAKSVNDVSDPAMATSTYNLVDLFLAYEPNEDTRFDVSLKNVFDLDYVQYTGGPSIDVAAAPGFEAKFGVSFKLGVPKK